MQMVICEICGKIGEFDNLNKALKKAIEHRHMCAGKVFIFDMETATVV